MCSEKDFTLDLVAWGKQYNNWIEAGVKRTLPVTKVPTCPQCGKFSYHCAGRFERHPTTGHFAADEWRAAVIGFVPNTDRLIAGSTVGIATILCPRCNTPFGFKISRDSFSSYVKGCPNWPQVIANIPAELSPEIQLHMKMLRKSAGFPNDHMSDQEFLAEHEKFHKAAETEAESAS